jgi:hypothetical protein
MWGRIHGLSAARARTLLPKRAHALTVALCLCTWQCVFPQAADEKVLSTAVVPIRDRVEDSNTRDEVEMAVTRGIEFLLSRQRDDGAITERDYDTTMTSLAIMALASTGATPASPGPQGDAIRRGLSFVLRDDRQDKDGYFGNRDGSRMYGHGITTLMLAEMLGMGGDAQQDRLIEARCQRGIKLILSAQQTDKLPQYRGGWRYTPNSNDSDLSVSVWHLLALRSAKNDGLLVPNDSIEQAIAYLQRSYTARLDARGLPTSAVAGFSYLPDNGNPSFAMTAAGLLALQVCGDYDSPLVAGAADWLLENPPKWKDRFFFYGTYYYAQGMYQRGGVHAEKADVLVRELLLPRQDRDGSWSAPSGEELGAGRTYATSLAMLSLSVKYHYLPIYQR